METLKFKNLISRYWEGETSLEEEQTLRKYLLSEEGKSLYPNEASLFGFYASQKNIETPVLEFPVHKLKDESKPKGVIHLFPYVRNIAAAFILVLGGYFVWNTTQEVSTKNNYVEIEDPKEALRITQEALAFLSKNVDKSEIVLKQSIAKLSITKIIKN